MATNKQKALLLLCVTGSSHRRYFYQLLEKLNIPVILMPRRGHWRFSYQAWCARPQAELNHLVTRMIMVSQIKRNRTYSALYIAIYRWLRLWEARLLFVRYYCYFIAHPSQLVAVWNGNKFYGATATIAARAAGRRMLFFEGGLLPKTTTMDDKGINYANSLPRDSNFYLQWAKKHQTALTTGLPQTLIPRAFEKHKQVIGEEAALPTHYIFIPFQVNGDSQIFNHSPWLTNMHQFYALLTRLSRAIKDKQIKLVIKEHPSCPMKYVDLHQAAKADGRIIFANLNNTQQLIENARLVITINSTVGLEALLLNKKVITLGDACYNLNQLVIHADNERQLIEAVNTIDDWQPDQQLRSAFLSFVYHHYCIPAPHQDPTDEHWAAIQRRLTLMAEGRDWLTE